MNAVRSILLFVFVVLTANNLSAQESPLSPGQKINLSIAGVPGEEIQKISKIYTVSDSGHLNLPYVEDVLVTGLSRSKLEKKIEQIYKSEQIYTNPTISIVVDAGDTTSRFVTVTGEVNRGGSMPFRPGMKLLDAVGAAGGFSDFANPSKVVLLRGEIRSQYSLKKVSENPKQNVMLKPNDTVIVPAKGW